MLHIYISTHYGKSIYYIFQLACTPGLFIPFDAQNSGLSVDMLPVVVGLAVARLWPKRSVEATL